MKVSKKTDYALRVLFHLADKYGSNPVPMSVLSTSNDVPKKFLEQIMLTLKRHGWVESLPGRYGGYTLAKPPGAISMGEVVRRLDGLLAPLECVSVTRYKACSQSATCRFRRVFLDIRNRTARIMDDANLASVLAASPVGRVEVFDLGFLGGDGI